MKSKRETPAIPDDDEDIFSTRDVTKRPATSTTAKPRSTTSAADGTGSTEKANPANDGPADLCSDPKIDAIVNAADGGIYVFKGIKHFKGN